MNKRKRQNADATGIDNITNVTDKMEFKIKTDTTQGMVLARDDTARTRDSYETSNKPG